MVSVGKRLPVHYEAINITIRKRDGSSTDFTLAPFASAQKGPNANVIPELDPEILEILVHRRFDLLLINEQNGAIQTDIQVRDEHWVVGDIISTEI